MQLKGSVVGTKQKVKGKRRYKKKEVYKISEEAVKNSVIILNVI
jgi:hypothetical protein